MKPALLSLLVTLSVSCQPPEEPVQGRLGPYEIVFPQNARQAIERYGVRVDSMGSWRLIRADSAWLPLMTVGLRRNGGAPYNLDRQAYAVSFFVPEHQIDSLKRVVQTQWGGHWTRQRSSPTRYKLPTSEYESLKINDSAFGILLMCYDSTRKLPPTAILSFCYGLTSDELNLFVSGQGYIIPDD